jgi:Cof subfamily protein (haloacid dehalogenase superfamily)
MKVIFFDVDGTLVDCENGIKNPTMKTKEALQKLKREGNIIVLSTGRAKSFLSKEILDLDFDGFITSNGSYIEYRGEELLNNCIDNTLLEDIINFFEINNIEYIIECQEKSEISDLKSESLQRLIELCSIPRTGLVNKGLLKGIKANKLVVCLDNEEKYKMVTEKYRDMFNFMGFSQMLIYDMYVNKYSKGSAINKLIEILNIDIKETYAFGDGINDIEMFKIVNKGIAMGGAKGELLNLAYYKTRSVSEEGIYYAIKNLVL